MMDGEMSRIFIGRLSPRTQERDLEHIFSVYGKVRRVDLKEGYAFVFFADQKNAAEAISAMDNKELDGNIIVVEAAHKYSSPKNNNVGRGNTELRISCSNLDQSTSWQDLKDWARAAGKVTFANVYTRDSQKMGVIEFETTSDVQNALQTLENIPCNGSRVRLEKEDPNETGGFTSGGGGMDRRGGGGGGSGFGRDLRERDRGSVNRDGMYPDRRGGGGGGNLPFRPTEGNSGRGDDRYPARERGDRDRGYDPRSGGGESRLDIRDAGASRYAEPSRFSDDYRRGAPAGPSYPQSAPAGAFYRGDDRREVVKREVVRSRSRSRGRDRDWGNSPAPPARFRAAEQPVAYRTESRVERRGPASAYDEYHPRGETRGNMRGDTRGDARGDHRGGGAGDYPARRAPAPAWGDLGYERGYESRGTGGYDRR